MASKVYIVPATRFHAEELAPLMRDADKAEVWASGNYQPLEILHKSLDVSVLAFALRRDNETIAIYGVAPCGNLMGGVGIIWGLTGVGVDKNRKQFVKALGQCVAKFLELYPVLIQYVDDRYEGALKLAKKFGFMVNVPKPFGKDKKPFRHIVLLKENFHV